jgi:16S rRNA (cytosine967-C5)-methyltransferase
MNISSLVGHVIELADLVDKNENTTRNKPGKPTDRIVGEFFHDRRYIGASDRRFISQATYGIVRHRRRLSTLVDQFAKDNPAASAFNERGSLRWLPRYVAYAIAIEETNPDEFLAAIGSRWKPFFPDLDLAAFVDWLGRSKTLDFLSGDDKSQLGIWYSFQDWMVREWVEQFGTAETEELLNAFNGEAPLVLRVNTLKTTVEEFAVRLQEEGVQTSRTKLSDFGLAADRRFNIQASHSFRDGLFEVQEEGSQLICLLTDPKPGMLVIDACAGAGGKSLMMAQLMHDEGEIVALDVNEKRLHELNSRAQRAGVSIIRSRLSGELTPEDYHEKADIVLVDAPCSGVGTIRRNPSLKWTVTQDHVEHFAQMQREIFECYARKVKSGGRLVYATCSLLRKENEDVVQHFLQTDPQYVPERDLPRIASETIASLSSNNLKLLPHRHGTDGFFAAVLRRVN